MSLPTGSSQSDNPEWPQWDSVDVQAAQEFVECAFGWAVVEVVAMTDLDSEWQVVRQAILPGSAYKPAAPAGA